MTTTARVTPTGNKLDDGFRCLIAFAEAPDVLLWEKQVTPPGVDGGDAIDTTTMHNQKWRTSAARALQTLTQSSMTVAYDPESYDSVQDLINVVGWITVHFPDGATLDFVGFLKDFQPGALVEGTQPEATCTIVPTNELDGVETDPLMTPGSSS
jgi:hypothetical protein